MLSNVIDVPNHHSHLTPIYFDFSNTFISVKNESSDLNGPIFTSQFLFSSNFDAVECSISFLIGCDE